MELELAPRRAAAARLVGRPRFLDDQPFPSFFLARARAARGRRSATCSLMRIVLDFDLPNRRSRCFAALDERQAAEIVVPLAQEVERDERDRVLAVDALDVLRVAQVNPALEPLEPHGIALRVERDDLAVDDERLASHRTRRARRRWKGTARSCRCRGATRRRTRMPARALRAGSISISARMPSYFGSKTRDDAGERRIGERREHRSRARRVFRARSQRRRERKGRSITEYSETDDPGRGGRRMPQVRICSISEYSVTDCQHLQPIGDINQQSSTSRTAQARPRAARACQSACFSKRYRRRAAEG